MGKQEMGNSMQPETKLCRHCRSEIPGDAKVCPYCRKKQKGGKLKWVIIAIVVLIAVAAIASTGGDSDQEDVKQVVVDGENETSSAENDSGTEYNDTEEQDDESSASDSDITIEEQVLLDQDGIVITATEYVNDSIWGDGIKLLLENNSDKDVTVSCDALIVNDYMISDLFASDIAAGKKSNETLDLYSSELEAAGIENVGQIEIYFHAYDSDTYDNIFTTDCITIQTSEYESMDTTPDDSGTELYNEGGIRIVGKTVDEDSFWGTAILLYCENNSGRKVIITAEDVSVNGFMVDAYLYSTIYDGKKAIDDITIYSSTLEENGIETIEDVELQFHIIDEETYDTIADSDVITFSAQ